MKKVLIILSLFLSVTAIPLVAQSTDDDDKKTADIVQVVPTEKKDKLVLHKTDNFKNTMVEIRYANSDYVGYVKMKKNKLEIDFSEVKPGTYTVVILGKDNQIQQFKYTKE